MKQPKAKSRSWKYRIRKRGSTGVEVLERAWELLHIVEPRIPSAVLTFVDSRSRGHLRGYFANSTWRKRRGAAHEVGISPKLIGQPAALLATMLHEAAHALLFEAGENAGMGSTDYYHTKAFRDQCVKFGLACNWLNCRYGWTLTSWPDSGVPSRYSEVIALLRSGLPAGIGGRRPAKVKGRSLPQSGHTMLTCSCDDGDRTVYVKKSVLQSGGIICSICWEEFKIGD